MKNIKQWSMEIGGKTLTVEVGRYAGQADAACTCRYGDTEVLATVVRSAEPRADADFLPLMVDYEEKFYAAGKIKGSRFMKREGRPTDDAVLVGRMIDRTIRPLFNQKIRYDVQVILTIFCIDEENDPDFPSLIATSVALSLSPIEWAGPIAGMRVGLINNEFVLNPTVTAQEKSDFEIMVGTGSNDRVLMIEARGSQVPESKVLECITFAKKHSKKLIEFITAIQKEVGAPKVIETPVELDMSEEEQNVVREFLVKRIPELLFNEPKATKRERGQTIQRIKDELDAYLQEKQIGKEKRAEALALVKKYVEEEVSRAILYDKKRVDGRAINEIRPIDIEVALFPRTHGSANFSRGDTQVVSVATLGSPGDVLFLDTMETEGKRHFMHHYNFPPFSVGEARPLRGAGRREIGHGALAEKALIAVLPKKEDFPYTIRVVSEVLSSNGSSSMASTCGSTLALMDAGVPIQTAVAGIAMGLASDEEKGMYQIITDLQDLEDGEGGMDFKICGTKNGITAIQLDTKTSGVPDEIIEHTFTQAREALTFILEKMSAVIEQPRAELSPYAPRIHTLHIDQEKIGLVIGPGGKTINKIIDETGVDIDIEKDGTVLVTSTTREGADKAIKHILDLTKEIEVGEIYDGKVTRVMDFGAFVELLPGHEGLVHVSNLSNDFVKNINDVVKVGDVLRVKVFERDSQDRINLIVEGVEKKPQERRMGNGFRGNGDRNHGARRPFNNTRRPRF